MNQQEPAGSGCGGCLGMLFLLALFSLPWFLLEEFMGESATVFLWVALVAGMGGFVVWSLKQGD